MRTRSSTTGGSPKLAPSGLQAAAVLCADNLQTIAAFAAFYQVLTSDVVILEPKLAAQYQQEVSTSSAQSSLPPLRRAALKLGELLQIKPRWLCLRQQMDGTMTLRLFSTGGQPQAQEVLKMLGSGARLEPRRRSKTPAAEFSRWLAVGRDAQTVVDLTNKWPEDVTAINEARRRAYNLSLKHKHAATHAAEVAPTAAATAEAAAAAQEIQAEAHKRVVAAKKAVAEAPYNQKGGTKAAKKRLKKAEEELEEAKAAHEVAKSEAATAEGVAAEAAAVDEAARSATAKADNERMAAETRAQQLEVDAVQGRAKYAVLCVLLPRMVELVCQHRR